MNHIRSRTSLLLFTLLALFATIALALPTPALAFTGIEGNSIYLTQNIGDDLYIGGNSVDISGSVDGDIFVAGQMVTISGTVTGNVYAAAQTVIISGEVKGDVMAASQTLRITGTVGKSVRCANQDTLIEGAVGNDVLAAGATVTISSTGSVGRDALVGAGSFNARGPIGRNIKADTTSLNVASAVGGNVDATSENVNIAQGAAIAGSLTYASDKVATIEGSVSGETIHKPAPVASSNRTKPQPKASMGLKISLALLGWVKAIIASMLMALIAILLLRGFTEKSATRLTENVWKSLGVGALAFFTALPVMMTILFIGIFIGGWGIAFLIPGLLHAVARIGVIVAAYAGGRLLFNRLGIRNIHPLLTILAAVVVIHTIGLIPYFGWLLGAAVFLFGMGAVILEIAARVKEENAPYRKTLG